VSYQTDPDQSARPHWTSNFPKYWSLLGSPLRPCTQDVELFQGLLAESIASATAPSIGRILLLGVTPEIALATWRSNVHLVAVDIAPEMITAIWPGNTDRRHAVCGDWCKAPFASGSFDLVIGDGCLAAVSHTSGLDGTIAEIHRCLRQDGLLLMRLFCRPAASETIEDVFSALQSNLIASFHAFKWRLAMAIQGMADAPDVAVADIWRIWNAAKLDKTVLGNNLGWKPTEIATIDMYRNSPARYNFLTLEAAMARLYRGGFDLVATRHGSYELGERCPHVLLRRRDIALPIAIGAIAK